MLTVNQILTRSLLVAGRPLLRIHLALYIREISHSLFPPGSSHGITPGEAPVRVLFIGELAVAGYGVLIHELGTVWQTVTLAAGESGSRIHWDSISSPTLTAQRAAQLSRDAPLAVDAVVLMLGIPDVLLMTSAGSWMGSLKTIINRVRERAGADCEILFAAIPPMARLYPVPAFASKVMTRQVAYLNNVTRGLVAEFSRISYVPFPVTPAGQPRRRTGSWADMHHAWAAALAPALARCLAGATSGHVDEEPSKNDAEENRHPQGSTSQIGLA